MSNLHVKYLLAGGGLASSSAAEAVREIDRKSSLLLVGQEINRPYHRPPLDKEFLRREKTHDELFTQPSAWFAEHAVQLRTGRRVSQIDAERRTVTLDDAEQISFDKMLIATGASAMRLTIPGSGLPGVFTIRTLEDIEKIHNAIDKSKHDGRKRAAVVGGGVLGVETAASLSQVGLNVDLILGDERPWNKFAGEVTGRFISKFLGEHGVTVHASSRPLRLEGDGRVQRVVISNDLSLPCDFVVTAVGMMPNKDLLRGTNIRAEKAILVDDHCRTSHADIFAAGDVAAVFDPLFGKHRILDHWDNAVVTGKLAGRNMAGMDEAYDAVNYFFSDVFDLSLSGWGEARIVERRLMREAVKPAGPADFVEFGLDAGGRIAQVLAINHRDEDEKLRELVKRRVNVGGREEALKDPSVGLDSFLK